MSDAADRPGDDDAPVEVLRRWEAAGALWQVLARRPGEVEVALLTCDAGEEVGRLTSGDPALLDYLGGRGRSDD
jgi:hypothetical protein